MPLRISCWLQWDERMVCLWTNRRGLLCVSPSVSARCEVSQWRSARLHVQLCCRLLGNRLRAQPARLSASPAVLPASRDVSGKSQTPLASTCCRLVAQRWTFRTTCCATNRQQIRSLNSTLMFLNLFAAAEPCISVTITHGTPCNDSWVQQSIIGLLVKWEFQGVWGPMPSSAKSTGRDSRSVVLSPNCTFSPVFYLFYCA